jgi:hypothetical protein
MTKAKAFDKAWKLAIKGDFSVYNEIVHPHYESLNQDSRWIVRLVKLSFKT